MVKGFAAGPAAGLFVRRPRHGSPVRHTLRATEVVVFGDPDQGEGWIEFRWPDPLIGWECLKIDFDGFCTRRMPIRSGSGLRDLALSRGAVRLQFSADLAAKMELPEAVDIEFTIPDDEFTELQQSVDNIGRSPPP